MEGEDTKYTSIIVMMAVVLAVLVLSGCVSNDHGGKPGSASVVLQNTENTPAKANIYLVKNPPGIALSLLDANYKRISSDCDVSLTVMKGRFGEDSYSNATAINSALSKSDFAEKVIGSGGVSDKRLVAIIPLGFTPKLGDSLKVTAVVKFTFPDQTYDIPIEETFVWG